MHENERTTEINHFLLNIGSEKFSSLKIVGPHIFIVMVVEGCGQLNQGLSQKFLQ